MPVTQWFGDGPELSVGQMSLRAAVIFFIALFLIRVSGRRSFGQRSPFDICVVVLLGAVLSRAAVGASPFWAVVSASAVIVLLHRGLAYASMKWIAVDRISNGRPRIVVENGRINGKSMRAALLTIQDIEEALRKNKCQSLENVERMVLERNGELTIILRKDSPGAPS